MISEEQLKKFEHQIEIGTLNCYKVVPELIAEVRRIDALWRFTSTELREKTEQLEEEINWLAQNCEDLASYFPTLRQGITKAEWRESARKAVQNKH